MGDFFYFLIIIIWSVKSNIDTITTAGTDYSCYAVAAKVCKNFIPALL